MRLWKSLLLVILALVLLAGCDTKYDPQVDIAALDAKVERFAQLVKDEDVDGIMAQYSADVEPEAYMIYGNMRGTDAIRASWANLFATMDVVNVEMVDLHHKLDRNLAVSYGTWQLTMSQGEMEQTIEGRFTNVLGRKEQHWQLLAVHVSSALPVMPPPVPMDAPAE